MITIVFGASFLLVKPPRHVHRRTSIRRLRAPTRLQEQTLYHFVSAHNRSKYKYNTDSVLVVFFKGCRRKLCREDCRKSKSGRHTQRDELKTGFLFFFPSLQFINAATQLDDFQTEPSFEEESAGPIRSSQPFELESGHIITLLDISLSKDKNAELQEFFHTQ